MTRTTPNAELALRRLRRPIALTRLGLAAERGMRAFWPALALALAILAVLMSGLAEILPLEVVWVGGIGLLGGLGWTLVRGIRAFRLPSRADALARLDETLPGRPLAALRDHQALGAGDAASEALWQAHLERMAERAGQARVVRPDLSVAARDPYALRYAALLAFLMALLFGSVWRVAAVGELAPGGAEPVLAAGPSWEAWVAPPAYTDRPELYLGDVEDESVRVPRGSRVTVRLYGDPGAVSVTETVSGRDGEAAEGDLPEQSFEVLQAGEIEIGGRAAQAWRVEVIPDRPPEVELGGPPERTVRGELRQPFEASDDYGIVGGRAVLRLDLEEVERRHGLATDPEQREPVTLDLPLPISGDRDAFSEVVAGEFAKHPWAGLPATIHLTVQDAAGQEGQSLGESVVLPERRFFEPLAAAVAEQRRDLLWSRDNAGRVAQVLRAVSWRPDEVFRSETAYLRLRVAVRRLETYARHDELTGERRDEIAEALWQVALAIEEGDLSDALERLRRAQDRLAEAMERGASEDEIAQLMDEMRDAMQDYMRQLAEQSKGEEQELAQRESQEITGEQLQEMLDRLQQLMEEGRMAEAQELLDQLSSMMENMQIARGQQGQGQGQGEQAMQELAETLREQQGLNDETFNDLQQQFGQPRDGQPGQPGQGQPGQPGQGRPGPLQPGQQGQGQPGQPGPGAPGQEQPGRDGSGEGALAERQQALRDELERQRGNLPGAGTPEGESAREDLDRAGRAMGEAEQALREDDYAGALDRQSEAMEALREGMRNLGESMAQNGQAGEGEGPGQAGERQAQRDPLGRALGSQGQMGTQDPLLQGEDVYRRTRELLDEIRRRSGDRSRPEEERDYLRRLLDRF